MRDLIAFRQSPPSKTSCTLVLHLSPTCTIDAILARSNTHSTDNTQDIRPVPFLALRGISGAQLMPVTPGTRRPSNDSVLNTTTWGARFVLLTLFALLAAGLSFADGNKRKVSSDLDALKGDHSGA